MLFLQSLVNRCGKSIIIDFFLGDSLSDQIAQALVACHEPKCASVSLIKKYITKYHPHLNIDTKPHLFKSALMRAISKGTIR